MIELKAVQLRKQYTHRRLFSELSFEHRSGVLGIAGANGSGKSTLLRCIAFLQGIDAGEIHWTQEGNTVDREDFRQTIGFVAPSIQFYDELTVQENMDFVQKMSGFDPHSISHNQAHPIDWLAKTQIKDLAQYRYQRLSTGQQQRVKLAIALSRNPSVLFLDEPGANLDALGKDLIKGLLTDLRKKGTLLFLASNDPKELDLCDRILDLDH
jgi:ABC-type multidrug transport system ATPase subunit